MLENRNSQGSSRSPKLLVHTHVRKMNCRQLTSTLIANKLCRTLKDQPNLSVRTIINYVEDMFQYRKKYGKAWRAKKRAWKMIYGDWEEGFEKLTALLNAMKAANPDMHYEYIPKPNAMEAGQTTIFLACILVLPPERRGLQALSSSVVH